METKSVPGFDCTFEEDFCGWTQPEVASTSWRREQTASRPNSISGPIGDHTIGNSSGFYGITEASLPVNSSGMYATSELNSPRLPVDATAPMCFSWWYMMHETHDTKLTVYWIRNANNVSFSREMWRRRGNYGRRWLYAQLQIDPNENIAFVRYDMFGFLNARSTVSIDDIQLTVGPCVRTNDTSIGCNFEDKDLCGYSSDEAADFSWTRTRGADLTVVDRPSRGKASLLFSSCSQIAVFCSSFQIIR